MVPEQFPYIVEIDAQAINRVLDNLFTNAFKYSGQNVRICLGAKKEGNEVWVYVEDNGNRMPDWERKGFSKDALWHTCQ